MVWKRNRMNYRYIILTSAIMQSTGRCQIMATMPSDTVNRVADAIFRCENSRKHPYGVMIPTANPRMVCINTINHAWRDFEGECKRESNTATRKSLIGLEDNNKLCLHGVISLSFIQFLGKRYCPPNIDPVGYSHWTNNVFRILNEPLN